MAWYLPTSWLENTGTFTRTTPYEFKPENGRYTVTAGYKTKLRHVILRDAPIVNFVYRAEGSTKENARRRWIRGARQLRYC